MATKDTGGQKRAARHEDSQDSADTVEENTAAADEVQERHDKLTDDVDSLLDEIDGVLEENAEEFVRAYVQKGGE
jgi:prokaryotic ubiquitin-like protein Pup